VADLTAIEAFIVIRVGTQRRALEREAREQAARARVGKDFGVQLGVGLRLRRTPHGTARHGGVRAERELARAKFRRALLVHHQQHDVGRAAADLKTDAAAFQTDGGRPAPARFRARAAGDHALAVFAAHQQAQLLDPRNQRYAVCPAQQVLGNRMVGCAHDFREHLGGASGALGRGFIGFISGP